MGLVRRSSPPPHELIEIVRGRGEEMYTSHVEDARGITPQPHLPGGKRARKQTAKRLVEVFGPEVRALADEPQTRLNESTAACGFLMRRAL